MKHHVVRRTSPAMASMCEIVLCGEDPCHLEAVSQAAFDEILRVERCLSKFDRASELSRLNREAARGECLVSFEMLQILQECGHWWHRTGGAFDIAAGSRTADGEPQLFDSVVIDASHRLVSFPCPDLRLDLGGYGKGYALDCAARLIRCWGISSACLHLGTSSVIAVGDSPEAEGWKIGLRDPDDAAREVTQILLSDAALSSSATWHTRNDERHASDLIEPRTGTAVMTGTACSVVAATAAAAEALSTAFTVLGRIGSQKLIDGWNDSALKVYWL